MITGRQIREARLMLGWNDETFCSRAGVASDVLTRAEAIDGRPNISLIEVGRIRGAFERAGVRFGRNGAVLMLGYREETS